MNHHYLLTVPNSCSNNKNNFNNLKSDEYINMITLSSSDIELLVRFEIKFKAE